MNGAAEGVAAGTVDGDGPKMNGTVAGATAGAAAAAGTVNVDGAVPKENVGMLVAAEEAVLACWEKPPSADAAAGPSHAFTLFAAAGPNNAAGLLPSVTAALRGPNKRYEPAQFDADS
jgi:hypothetical protein